MTHRTASYFAAALALVLAGVLATLFLTDPARAIDDEDLLRLMQALSAVTGLAATAVTALFLPSVLTQWANRNDYPHAPLGIGLGIVITWAAIAFTSAWSTAVPWTDSSRVYVINHPTIPVIGHLVLLSLILIGALLHVANALRLAADVNAALAAAVAFSILGAVLVLLIP